MAKLWCLITGLVLSIALGFVPIIGPALFLVSFLSFLFLGMIPAAIIDANAKTNERRQAQAIYYKQMLGRVNRKSQPGKPAVVIFMDARSVHTHNNIWMEEVDEVLPPEVEYEAETRQGSK
jgi:hypothetical protein